MVGQESGVDPRGDRDDDGLDEWLNRHAVFMLAAVAAGVALRTGVWVAVASIVSFSVLWYRQRRKHTGLRPYGGYANWLTALRLALVLAAAALMTALPGAWLWILFAANVVIDVGDGYVARHWNQVSAFGAVFDREVDAVFVLIVYLYFFVAHEFAVWILAPGLLPYAYRLAVSARRHRPLPDQRERFAPLLAGINYVVLLIAVAAPTELQLPVLVVSTSLVMASFLGSFLSLYRNEYSLP